MYSVTQRISKTRQPRGGFLPPRSFAVSELDCPSGVQGLVTRDGENCHPSTMGLVVDYLSRVAQGATPFDAFRVSLLGAETRGEQAMEHAERLVNRIHADVLDPQVITAARWLVGYDVYARVEGYIPSGNVASAPNAVTIQNAQVMLERSAYFFSTHGPVVRDGFTFVHGLPDGSVKSGYTETVSRGDGDFLTGDTLWDFKVSIKPPTSAHSLQLLMYYLMGLECGDPDFAGIERLGVFNPRLNTVYTLDLGAVSDEVVETVRRDVIGYVV